MATETDLSTPDLDVVVFGATGFTGRLVAEHLATRGDDALRWGIAGRDAEKLATVAAALDVPDGTRPVPTIVADASDPAALRRLVTSAAVVVSTVGPYAEHGGPLVAACVEAGTDYVDLTGEPQFVRRMIDEHQDHAEETGARIVHCCGFDSVPSDIGVLVAQQAMQERHGVAAQRVHMRVRGARGGASGGTIASLVGVLAEASADPAVADVLDDPHSLLPAGERVGAHSPSLTTATRDPHTDAWIAPFVMEVVNAKVVRRTNALLGYPWGREFRYDEAMVTGRGPAGQARATAIATSVGAAQGVLGVDALRPLVERLLPSSGTGPGEGARERGFFTIEIIAEHPTGPGAEVRVEVVGDRDPGYGATSRMIGEAALVLAHGESEVGGGIWTPASALGDALRTRLEQHAGVTFTVTG